MASFCVSRIPHGAIRRNVPSSGVPTRCIGEIVAHFVARARCSMGPSGDEGATRGEFSTPINNFRGALWAPWRAQGALGGRRGGVFEFCCFSKAGQGVVPGSETCFLATRRCRTIHRARTRPTLRFPTGA